MYCAGSGAGWYPHLHTDATPPDTTFDQDMSDWIHIAKVIRDAYDEWDGFVVLHGTDTMAYTTSVCSGASASRSI